MINLASIDNLNEIMDIINLIKEEMREENNPQWGILPQEYPNLDEDFIDYPNRVFIESDIDNKELYIFKENNIIKGIISICEEKDEYQGIVNTSNKKSIIIHRVAVPKNYRKSGIAQKLFYFAENKAKNEGLEVIKVDTEESNKKMHNLLIKLGFKVIDNFSYDDYPGKYVYYEKEI